MMKKGMQWVAMLCGLFCLSFGFAAYSSHLGPPLPYYREETQVSFPVAPAKVEEGTIVDIQDSWELCLQTGLACSGRIPLTGQARNLLNGKGTEDLVTGYPAADGWQFQWEDGGAGLLIWRSRQGFCEEHRQYWHFEAGEANNLEVYTGPAGSGKIGELILATNINVEHLPELYRVRVEEGMWQFRDWDELQNVIDGFDS